MSKSKSLQPLARILATDSLIGAWHDRMQRESRLTAAVRRALPRALAERVRVAEATTATLHLAVTAGAVAAVIRQRTPDILAGLRREGWDFTELHLRVQVTSEPAGQSKKPAIQRDRVVTTPLARLAGELPTGPLREAIERLVRRSS